MCWIIFKINFTSLFPQDPVEILLATDKSRFSLSLKVEDRKAHDKVVVIKVDLEQFPETARQRCKVYRVNYLLFAMSMLCKRPAKNNTELIQSISFLKDYNSLPF